MSGSVLAAGIRHLRGRMALQHCNEDSDEQLLHAFTTRREESAFAVLVRRHGPMVLHVCRRVLGHEQDAEDAFQAVFLVLARNVATLRKKSSLASFLHGTAYRTAMKAKQSAARRRKHEGSLGALTQPRSPVDPADELSWREVRVLLDEEIARLPEIYRSVFILCCLENVSQAEGARRLEVKEKTVSSRLTEARKRLGQRLVRRGVELTAVLGAAVLAVPPASALSPVLMASTIKAALATAAGEGLAGMVSASVAALVKNSSSVLSFGKAKLAMLLLAGSLLGGGGAVVHFQQAAAESEEPPTAEKVKPQRPAAPAAKEDQQSKTFAGRVLDPDGKPIAGAKLYLLYYTPKELPIPVRAVSDKDGRFRFTVARKDFDCSASARPWNEAIVVATAQGYGLGLPAFQLGEHIIPTGPSPKNDQTLRMTKDEVPITGRVVDLQGKPVGGVTVHVRGLYWPAKGDLTDWLKELKAENEAVFSILHRHLIALDNWIGRDLGKVFPPAVTGADGRFRLAGVGGDRVVTLSLEGPTIATAELFALTRPGGTIRPAQSQKPKARGGKDEMIVCGSPFEYLAVPCHPIVGVVRDKDSGKPLPGAIVRSVFYARFAVSPPTMRGYQRAVADKEGRYRLTGIPKSEVNQIRAEGPDGQPYLMSLARVPEGIALEPITVNFQLKRGVWIEGTVTDKATGKPVPSFIRCAVFDDNPFRAEAAGLTFDNNMRTSVKEGSFRFAGLPGRSVVMAQAWEPRYLTRVGADRIKDLDSLSYLSQPLAQSFHSIVEINPAKDAKVVRCDLKLDPGGTRNGTVIDADGRPLVGVRIAGLKGAGGWEHLPLRTAAFTVVALQKGETRLLQFSHAEKRLAGSFVVRSDTKGPITVKLKPAATLIGRFIRPDGKPFSDVELYATIHEPVMAPRPLLQAPPADPSFGTFPSGLRTDKDGKFRIENLAPDLKYRFGFLYKQMYVLRADDGPTRTGTTVKAGETKNLGDVTVKAVE